MNATIPCSTNRLHNAIQRVRETRVTETCGRVVQLIGLVVESESTNKNKHGVEDGRG